MLNSVCPDGHTVLSTLLSLTRRERLLNPEQDIWARAFGRGRMGAGHLGACPSGRGTVLAHRYCAVYKQAGHLNSCSQHFHRCSAGCRLVLSFRLVCDMCVLCVICHCVLLKHFLIDR